MANKRLLVQFEMEIDEKDLDNLLPNVFMEDGTVNVHASLLGPLGDGICRIISEVTPTFKFGPFGILDRDENAGKMIEVQQ